jgi:MerR family transcriptional regulator, light-induced transcriptional regulator
VTGSGLTAGEAARRMGVAVTTLRTWHQRYGLGPSEFIPGRHRRYTEADMSRLLAMHALTSEGIPAAQAARTVLAKPNGASAAATRAGGGNAIPVGRDRPAARGLAAAAMRLDAAAMIEVITASITAYGTVSTWEQLIRPVLGGLGRRQSDAAQLVDVEHLLSRSVTEALAAVTRSATGGSPRTLLACADEEQHTLPLEALAAALAESGVTSRLLGARVPPEALDRAVARTGPVVVAIWSQSVDTADPGQLAGPLAARPRPLVVIAAGPGWDDVQLPPGVTHPATLVEALDLTLTAVGQST